MKRQHALADSSAPRRSDLDPVGVPLQLHAIVLLAGGVGPNSLSGRLGRSVLNVPIGQGLELKDLWRQRVDAFAPAATPAQPSVGVVVLTGAATPAPSWTSEALGRPLEILEERSEFRGTAGALRDLLAALRPDDHVLLGTASQCPEPGQLRQLLEAGDPAASITIGVDRDMTPSGLLLLRGDALAGVPAIGFHDLKEQVLPRLASTQRVQVIQHATPAATPIRDLAAYVRALRSWHRVGSLVAAATEAPLEERWRSTFSIIEEGARVHPSARLHDAVVLAGGSVEANSEVARSVIAAGGVVRRGSSVVDRIVGGPGQRGTPTGPAGRAR